MTARCASHCDFERARLVSRATWACPDCGRDISIAYLFWVQAAHPEWFEEHEPPPKTITPARKRLDQESQT